MASSGKINTLTLIKIFLRSFFLQSVWNYQSLLSVGFAFALVPVANTLYSEKEQRIAFLKRHLKFFNAHPYFAAYALGAITRVESEAARNEGDLNQVDRFKNALIGPLGALGDQMFWGTIKPAAILLGVIAVLITDNIYTFLYLFIFLLLLYNVPHLYIRYYGIVEGYRKGFEVYRLIKLDRYRKYRNFYVALGALSLGFIIAYSFLRYETNNLFQGLVFAGCVFGAFYFHTLSRSFYRNVVFLLVLAVCFGILVENL
jgi:mannose/fructose/N-acetylgalactosamine-specific phosphotransferase system component IID